MRKLILSIVSLLLAITLITSSSVLSFGDKSNVESNKVSSEVIRALNETNNDELLSVYIWFEDIDVEAIHKQAETEMGYSFDDLRDEEDKIEKIDGAVFELEDEDSINLVKDYMQRTKSERSKLLKKVDGLTALQRKKVSDEYINYNILQAHKTGVENKDIKYISKFSPVIIASLKKTDIKDLSNNEEIVYIGYHDDTPPKPAFSNARTALQSDYTISTLGLTGYGVKVGMYDSGKVGTNSYLTSSNITKLDSSATVNLHSTNVASIIVGSSGFAPDAHLYSNSSAPTSEEGIEDLVAQGVYAINLSLGYDRSNGDYYNDFEKWIDHIVYQHNVSMVVASGNDGLNSVVNCPGLALNAITVGATDTLSTSSRSDDILATYTSTLNGGTSGCAKPDFLAPGIYNGLAGEGTSYAAPAVTGIIAQMIELKPTVSSSPAIIKAVLNSSTDKKVIASSSEAWAGPLTPQQGAGQVNAKRAMSLLSNARYSSGTITTGYVTKQFSVTSSDTYIRCNVSWLRKSVVSGSHNNIGTTGDPAANLRLQCLNPSNTSVGSSNFTNSSVELVHFSVNSVYGTYTAKAIRMDSGTDSVKYAMAWY